MDIIINGTIYSSTYPIGMSYVGLTTRTGEIRWDEHIRKSRWDKPPAKISRAIKKHGHEKFKFKVLHTGITDWQLLNELEIEEIAKHNSCDRGYNCHKGGLPEFRLAKIWEHREEIEYMHEIQKKSVAKIAKHFGVGEKTIRKLLDRLGIEHRNAGYYTKGSRRHWLWKHEIKVGYMHTSECFTVAEIAEHFNVSTGIVYKILRSLGIKPQQRPDVWLHKHTIGRMYKIEERSLKAIAQIYDTDSSTIKSILKHLGIPIRDPKHALWEQSDIVSKMYWENLMATDEVAKHFGVSSLLVREILLSFGRPLRNYREAQLLYLARKSSNTQLTFGFAT